MKIPMHPTSCAPAPAALLAALLAAPCLAQPGGPGGPDNRELQVKQRFDADRDGRLDETERARARAWVKSNRAQRGPGRGPGPGAGPGGRMPPGQEPGAEPREPKRVAIDQARAHPDRQLYDPQVVRTIFLEFPQADWEAECADFYRTDVEVPARMIVDGKAYKDVGVGFRGNSSYFGAGKKKSFSIAVDAAHKDQRLYGYRTLNLLNAHADPSFVREAVHAFVTRAFTPAMQSNLVQLVINGENWGIYANVQQYNTDFLADEYGTRGGVRWKVPAGFRGSGLAWLGDDPAAYQRSYELKTEVTDPAAAWRRLLELCRLLHETPDEELEAVLPRVLDIDATLWFLAVDAALLDGDGYASRASDFLLWEGADGRFRPLPYDSNEILSRGPGGPRGTRGPGAFPPRNPGPAGPESRPQAGLPESGAFPPPDPERRRTGAESRPLLGPGGQGPGPGGRGGMMMGQSPTAGPLALLDLQGRPLARLLKVGPWRARYLAHLRALAQHGLDWERLGPFVEALHASIDAEVEDDDKALYGYQAFTRSLGEMRQVLEQRRKVLLEHETMRGPWPEIPGVEAELTAGKPANTLRVRVKVAGEAPEKVILYVAPSRSAAFREVPLQDDGQHGDGESGDRTFGGQTEVGRETKVWYYVEARAAAAICTTAFWPEAAGGRPKSASIGRQ
jgi:spore coat protein CotH